MNGLAIPPFLWNEFHASEGARHRGDFADVWDGLVRCCGVVNSVFDSGDDRLKKPVTALVFRMFRNTGVNPGALVERPEDAEPFKRVMAMWKRVSGRLKHTKKAAQ